MIGAGDVFLMSRSGIGAALDRVDDDGSSSDDAAPAAGDDDDDDVNDSTLSGALAGAWGMLLGGSADHGEARRTMLAGVSAMYAVSGLAFLLAMGAPRRWPGCAK
jgi:hypothetical protein